MILEAAVGAVAGLLTRTDVLSHITRRLVTDFGGDDGSKEQVTVIVALDDEVRGEPDPLLDRLISPPPARLLLLNGGSTVTLPILGFVLDGQDGSAGAVSWVRVSFDCPTVLNCPANTLAILPALSSSNGLVQELRAAEVASFGSIDGCHVFSLA